MLICNIYTYVSRDTSSINGQRQLLCHVFPDRVRKTCAMWLIKVIRQFKETIKREGSSKTL